MLMRADKYVSEVLGVSRADARKIIFKKQLYQNEVLIKKIDEKIDADINSVIDGVEYRYEEFVYIMLNKPLGVVSASKDKNDVTVIDLVKNDFPKRNLFPAGRLDKASTGFVLITDDGKFAHDILSPKNHVPKYYEVVLDAQVTQEVQDGFENGVTLVDGTVLKSASIYPHEDKTKAKVVLKQGVYHQIKRMLGVFDIGVNELHRTQIGQLEMPKELNSGEFIKLTKEEVDKITMAG